MIEAVTCTTYEAAIRELVLTPLGMAHSCFFAEDAITHRLAVGHTAADTDATPVVVRPWAVPRCGYPAGGLISSVRDLLRYARFHLGDGVAPGGARLLAAASIALMRTPLVPAGGYGDHVGLTWMLQRVGGVQTVSHEGTVNGQACHLLLVPDRHFALMVLTNVARGLLLSREISAWALRQYLSVEEPEQTPLVLAEEERAAYSGRYVSGSRTIDLLPRGDGLTMRVLFTGTDSAGPALPEAQLTFLSGERAVIAAGPYMGARVEFLRDRDGYIMWFRFSGRVHRREGQ
jgi:hypothetical protein